MVLQPKTDMVSVQLLCVAADYNRTTRWRFSWYRQITTEHIKRLSVRLPSVNGQPDRAAAQAFARANVLYWEVFQQAHQANLEG